MKRILIGSFLAALAGFFLGAVFWMSSPVSHLFGSPRQPDALGKALLDQLPESGVYVYPPAVVSSVGSDAERDAASRQGPIALIHFRREGQPMLDPKLLFHGFLVGWLTMFLTAILLSLACPALPGYGSRVLMVTLIGLIVASNSDLGATVWWHHSLAFAGTNAIYNGLSFFLGGLILAKFIRRK